ncbi:hypothetical protein RHMOL_Rhmol12G0107800 [Rhododendron molle]|uniref:Uncharacterized protein n=1 Tax=Rhododendron molle TaxID=49168 RepID=A0ACC0LHT8_RHOML|nr:hypothetical protein RHMOL_Rhmol12G0107800 [Rhododendron molle]
MNSLSALTSVLSLSLSLSLPQPVFFVASPPPYAACFSDDPSPDSGVHTACIKLVQKIGSVFVADHGATGKQIRLSFANVLNGARRPPKTPTPPPRPAKAAETVVATETAVAAKAA